MLSRENEYFENLRKIGEAYDIIRKAHEEKKQKIIEECGWDSEELKAWYDVYKIMWVAEDADSQKDRAVCRSGDVPASDEIQEPRGEGDHCTDSGNN